MIRKLSSLLLITATSLLFLNIESKAADVDVSATVPDSTASFSGFGVPGAIITIKEGSNVVGATIANASGEFSKTIVSTPGEHTFSIFQTDTSGRSTPEIVLPTLTLPFHIDTPVENIQLPPTLELSKTTINEGSSLKVFGQGTPGSKVNLFLNDVQISSLTVNSGGDWEFVLKGGYKLGGNEIRAFQSKTGLANSKSSFTVKFTVVSCDTDSCPTLEPPPPPPPPQSKNYNFYINLRQGLGNLFSSIVLLISFIVLIPLLFLILFFLWRRRKPKKDILEKLERKVEADLPLADPKSQIRKDFQEAEKEFE